PFWALEARVPWNTAFWLYMAVGSYLVVPLVEEFFTRGYLLGRVRESFSAGGSLLLASVFFFVAHGQYRHTDILAIGAQISLLLWAAIAAYSVMRTASLVPAIIAHAIINVPMTVTVRWIMLVVSLIALAVWREAVVSWTKGMITTLRQIDDWLPTILALIAIVLLLTTIAMTQWIVYVYVTVLGMLALLGIRQRSAWSAVIEPITRG
ncbi:MAG: lysostaphin resistance A-like protein, partial [bacterium]